jgi:curved DNA-binding protein CbpA
MLILDPVPSAFVELNVAPYLSDDGDSSALLKKHFVKLTRALHPDLLGPDADDSEKEAAEARLAALNAALIAQRDLKDRIDLLLETTKRQFPSIINKVETQKLPPQYAMQYFEIQEALEACPQDPSTLSQLEIFKTQLHSLSQKIDSEILQIAQKYPLDPQSIGRFNSYERRTWSLEENDLEVVARLRGQQKYVDRLIHDLDSFVKRLGC